MSKLLTIIGGITGTVAIGGTATYFLTKENPKPLLKEQFSHSLILLDGKEDDLLKEKLAKLKVSTIEPNNAKLKEAKTKAKVKSAPDTAGLDELKKACQEIYDSSFNDKNSVIFKDFETYCSKNIKDQISKTKWALNDKAFTWNTKLAGLNAPNKVFVDSLKAIVNKAGGAKDVDLKGWCESVENTLFEGPEDITFKNANEFCKKD